MEKNAADTFRKLDFTTFILSISSAAFLALERRPDAAAADLVMARQNIDLLELMQEKTRGNLAAEEARLLERLLYETRMKFIEAQEKK